MKVLVAMLISFFTFSSLAYSPYGIKWNQEKKVQVRCLGSQASGSDREHYEILLSYSWVSNYIIFVKMRSHLKLIDRRSMRVVSQYDGRDLETSRNEYEKGFATDYQFPNVDLRFYWDTNLRNGVLKGEGQAYFKAGHGLYLDKMDCFGTQIEKSY